MYQNSEDIVSFQAEMKLWMQRMEGGRTAAFPALKALVEKEFDLKSVCGIFLEKITSFLYPSWIDRHSFPQFLHTV